MTAVGAHRAALQKIFSQFFVYGACWFQAAFEEEDAVHQERTELVFVIFGCRGDQRRVHASITSTGQRDMRPKLAPFFLETEALHPRIQPFGKPFHRRRLHAGPEDSWGSRSREESDALNSDRERLPGQAAEHLVDIVNALLPHLTDKFQRDVDRY